jgi:hypothetical protein
MQGRNSFSAALGVTARFAAPRMHGAADGEAIRFTGRAAFESVHSRV